MRYFFVILAVAFLVVPTAASATEGVDVDHPAIAVGYQSSWHLFGGILGGGAFHSGPNSGFAGGQVSIVRLKHGRWIGAYAGGQFDFRHRLVGATVGPELGYKFLGVDAGVGARYDDGDLTFGPQGRLMVTAALLTVFGRYSYWPQFGEQTVEVGLIIKLPLIAPWGYDPFDG